MVTVGQSKQLVKYAGREMRLIGRLILMLDTLLDQTQAHIQSTVLVTSQPL